MDARTQLRHAVRVIRAGGVLAYPTEAVFGLGCDPGSEEALARILEIKGRSAGSGFILIAADAGQLEGWIAPTATERRNLLSPAAGPVTWVVTAGPRTGPLVSGGRGTVAVRITSHPLAAALCQAAGMPLVSTSANRHGRPPARTTLEARRRLGRVVDFVLTGETLGLARPSEIRVAGTGEVLRSG